MFCNCDGCISEITDGDFACSECRPFAFKIKKGEKISDLIALDSDDLDVCGITFISHVHREEFLSEEEVPPPVVNQKRTHCVSFDFNNIFSKRRRQCEFIEID